MNKKIAMRQRISEIFGKIKKQSVTATRHLNATIWLLGDLTRLLRWRVITIGLFGLAAVGCKFLAAGVLYLFVDALAADQDGKATVPVLAIEFDLQQFFVIGVVVGAILMMLSTAMQFRIRRAAMLAAASFEERAVRRVLAAASRLPHPEIVIGGEMVRRADLMAILNGARSCNMVARQAVQLTPSIISLVTSIIVLTVIDPMLTSVIMLAFLAVIILQYPMTNRSVRASDASEIDRRAAMSDVRGFVDRLRGVSAEIGYDHGSLNRLFGRGSAFQQDIRTFTRRIDGMILADLTARLGNHVVLAGLFIFIGTQILSGARDWASFAAYVAIARLAMKDFQVTAKIMGQIARVFLPLDRYMQFIRAATTRVRQSKTAPVLLDLLDMNERPISVQLQPHENYGIIVPKPGHAEISEIYARTTDQIPPTVLDDSLLDADASMRINLTLEEDVDQQSLEAFVQAVIKPEQALKWRSDWLDQPSKHLPSAEPWMIMTLKAAVANIHDRPGVIVQAAQLKHLPANWVENCLTMLRSGPLLVVSWHLGSLAIYDAQQRIIVAENGRLRWFVGQTELPDLLLAIEARTTRAAPNDQGEDDTLMMM